MLNIGKPITARGAREYFKEDLAKEDNASSLNSKKSEEKDSTEADIENNNENLFNQISPRSLWCGQLAEEFNLSGEVKEKEFALLCEGRHPHTGEQLIRHVKSRTKTKANGKTFQTMTHRAGVDLSISPPKSVSLVAMEDTRVIEAHWRSGIKAITVVGDFTRAKMGNTNPSEKTGKALFAIFLHDLSRPDKKTGLPAPDLHNHNLTIGFTKTKDGKFRAVEMREFYVCQKFATAVYRAELVKEMTKIGYQMKIDKKTGAPEVVGLSREYIEANSPRQKEIIETATELGIKSTKIVASNYRRSKNFDREAAYERYRQIERQFGNQSQKVAEKAREISRQNSSKERELSSNQLELKALERAEKTRQSFDLAIAKAKEQKHREKPKQHKVSPQSLMADAFNFARLEITIDDIKPEFATRQKNGEMEEFNLDRRGKSASIVHYISNTQKPDQSLESNDKTQAEKIETVSTQKESSKSILRSEGDLIKENGERTIRRGREFDDSGRINLNGQSVIDGKIESRQETGRNDAAGNGNSPVKEFHFDINSNANNIESRTGSALGVGGSTNRDTGVKGRNRGLPYRVRRDRRGKSVLERIAGKNDEKSGGSGEGSQSSYQSAFTDTDKEHTTGNSADRGQFGSDIAQFAESEHGGSKIDGEGRYGSGIETQESGAEISAASASNPISETGTAAEIKGGAKEEGSRRKISSGRDSKTGEGQILSGIATLEESGELGIKQMHYAGGNRQNVLPIEQQAYIEKDGQGKGKRLDSSAGKSRTGQEFTNTSNEPEERAETSLPEALALSEFFSESTDDFRCSDFNGLESDSLDSGIVQFNNIREGSLADNQYTNSSPVFDGTDIIFNKEQPESEQLLLSGQICENISSIERISVDNIISLANQPGSLDSIQFSQPELVGNSGNNVSTDNFNSANAIPEFVINIPKVADLKSLSDEEKDKIKEEVLERLSDKTEDRTFETQSVGYDAEELDEINDHGYEFEFEEISVFKL